MKLLNIIIIYLLIFIPFLYASSTDTLVIKTKRVKGFGPAGVITGYLENMSKDNPWYSTIPEIKGIPDTLENFMFAAEETDFLQQTYQNNYMGNISNSRFEELKKTLPLNLAIGFAEHRLAEVDIDGMEYKLALCCTRPDYRSHGFLITIKKDEKRIGSALYSQRIKMGERFSITLVCISQILITNIYFG